MADEKQRERFGKALEQKQRADEASARAHEEQLAEADRPQDTQSARAKSSRHGKVTADKWNQ